LLLLPWPHRRHVQERRRERLSKGGGESAADAPRGRGRLRGAAPASHEGRGSRGHGRAGEGREVDSRGAEVLLPQERPRLCAPPPDSLGGGAAAQRRRQDGSARSEAAAGGGVRRRDRERGMSADDRLFLDHVAVVVPDLARAAKTYERLGFRLTPQSSHKGALTPGGPFEPYGSGNHCAMFAEGYLEILGITDPKRYTGEVAPLLQRYVGLHLVALGCRDARKAARDLGHRLGAELSVRELGRDVPQVGGGTKPAQFRIVGLPPGTFPEAKLFLIEQVTPDVLWQPALLDHPNGVTGLAGAVLCVN